MARIITVSSANRPIVSRRFKKMRHLSGNGMSLCRECHNAAHASPRLFLKWFREQYKVWHASLISICADNGYPEAVAALNKEG